MVWRHLEERDPALWGDIYQGFFLKKDEAGSLSWLGQAKLKRSQNQCNKKGPGLPASELIPFDPTMCQLLY